MLELNKLQTARSVSDYVGLDSAVQTLEQASYHMPGWLTLAEQVQIPYHARVLKNTCKQMMSFAHWKAEHGNSSVHSSWVRVLNS